MFQFLVNAPGPTDQGWWCRTLQWGCDGGADLSRHAPIAPEITDGDVLRLIFIVMVFSVLWFGSKQR